MPVNKEHLLKIKQHILEEPLRLNMSAWLETGLVPGTLDVDSYNQDREYPIPQCGTVGCIAGWSAFLDGRKIAVLEDEFLGLPNDNLFFPTNWPVELHARYTNATTAQEKAVVTGEAIDLIIAGDGRFPGVRKQEENHQEEDYY